MCGIIGGLSFISGKEVPFIGTLLHMMERRGPDDEGLWTDSTHCTLGFRRLSILDLSEAGHQPMQTPDGRYLLVFNGEVYNFQILRRELEHRGCRFRSTGDAEVVLHALAQWGTQALDRFNGMFALGFYDTLEKRLLLARDHAGIKPLYYMHTALGVVFASQYDQILAHPWRRDLSVNGSAFGLYMRLGYIPAPFAALDQTHMIEPGTWLEVGIDKFIKTGRFYEFPRYQKPDLHGAEALEAVDAAVSAAVKRQLVSDVPVGTFLSGGIDSPLVAAKMQVASKDPVKAFTLGTQGDSHDESEDAAAYAQEIGLDHIIEHVTPEKAVALLDEVVSAGGEPFADYSLFPTLLITRKARQHVKVMLSGDGGDELFWGYAGRFGSVLSKAADFKDPQWFRNTRWGVKKLLGLGNGYWNLRMPSIGDWYRAKHSHLDESWLARIFPELPPWPPQFDLFSYDGSTYEETAQWLRWNEFVGHLPRVLLKVDRASMYNSLEVRVPLLDREVIDVAARMDWNSCLDVKGCIGKIPLRYALRKHIQYQTQAKRGFSVPMDEWLRGALRPVFEESVLSRRDLIGIPMNAKAMEAMYRLHCTGERNYGWGLWILLSLALWEEKHYYSQRLDRIIS